MRDSAQKGGTIGHTNVIVFFLIWLRNKWNKNFGKFEDVHVQFKMAQKISCKYI